MNDTTEDNYVRSIAGTLYVYVDEDGGAIAVARNAVGPQGGWTADSIARMAMPGERLSRAEINDYARKFASAPELYEALSELLASCDRGPPALHDDCGTTIISAPHPDAMRKANAILRKARGES